MVITELTYELKERGVFEKRLEEAWSEAYLVASGRFHPRSWMLFGVSGAIVVGLYWLGLGYSLPDLLICMALSVVLFAYFQRRILLTDACNMVLFDMFQLPYACIILGRAEPEFWPRGKESAALMIHQHKMRLINDAATITQSFELPLRSITQAGAKERVKRFCFRDDVAGLETRTRIYKARLAGWLKSVEHLP